MTKENRAAVLSVRAKARKALNVTGADLPAAVQKHLQSVVEWADKQLAAAAPKQSQVEPKAATKAKGKAKASSKKSSLKKAA